MSKGVHNIAFYVSPDPECSRTTQNSEISLAPSRGRILYAIYGNSTCVINHIVVTAIDKKYRNYYISTPNSSQSDGVCCLRLVVEGLLLLRIQTRQLRARTVCPILVVLTPVLLSLIVVDCQRPVVPLFPTSIRRLYV